MSNKVPLICVLGEPASQPASPVYLHTIVDTLTHSCRVKLAFRKGKKSNFGFIGIDY